MIATVTDIRTRMARDVDDAKAVVCRELTRLGVTGELFHSALARVANNVRLRRHDPARRVIAWVRSELTNNSPDAA